MHGCARWDVTSEGGRRPFQSASATHTHESRRSSSRRGREVRVELGTFTPPANATDEQLDEWAVLLADEIGKRLGEPTPEEQDAVKADDQVALDAVT